jgi:hypothetical protein
MPKKIRRYPRRVKFPEFDWRTPQVAFWEKFERRTQRASAKKQPPDSEHQVSRATREAMATEFARRTAIHNAHEGEDYRSRDEARGRRRATQTVVSVYREIELAERFGDWRLVYVAKKLLGHLQRAAAGGNGYHPSAEFATGVRALELQAAKRKPVHRSQTAPHSKCDDDDGGNTAGALVPGATPIEREEWDRGGYKTHMTRPFFDKELGEVVQLHVYTEDRKLLERILAKSPGKRRGRPRKRKESKR